MCDILDIDVVHNDKRACFVMRRRLIVDLTQADASEMHPAVPSFGGGSQFIKNALFRLKLQLISLVLEKSS